MRDDAALVDRLRAAARGDRKAFEEVVLLRRETVVRIARRIVGNPEDARDVAQAVFLKLWKVLRRFDVERRFDTWLYRITVNAAIDHLRERGPRGMIQPLPDDPSALVAAAPAGAGREADLADLRRAFLRLAAGLAPKQRAVFVLREIEGLDTPEIARMLGVAESTVRNHLLQARQILRRGLIRDYPGLVPPKDRP
jgi:RNA polymerase sigma-70 factor (ECF subfamily)